MSSQSISRLVDSAKKLQSDRARALLSLGIVLGLGSVSTLAYWTDTATATGGTFTAGTFNLKLSGVENNPAAFTNDFKLANMQPGNSKAAVFTVENAGTIDLKYTATGIAPGALGALLFFNVVPGGSVSGTGTAMSCSSGPGTFSNTMNSTQTVVGSSRTIAAGGSESFCVSATLPTGTTAGQGTSTTATFTFKAQQLLDLSAP